MQRRVWPSRSCARLVWQMHAGKAYQHWPAIRHLAQMLLQRLVPFRAQDQLLELPHCTVHD